MQYLFSNNLFWSTNLKYTIFDNFNDLYIPPLDTYPNQVRSDIKKYLNNFGGRPIIGRSQIDFLRHFWKTIIFRSQWEFLKKCLVVMEQSIYGVILQKFFIWNRTIRSIQT